MSATLTVAEYLAWAKERALAYCDAGDGAAALASITSDLRKHEQLADHAGLELGYLLALGGHLSTVQQVREHIEGFN